MFYLLTFAIFLAALAGVARINSSNKLFWTLVTSGLLGFAVGSFHHGVTAHNVKKENITSVVPMQVSMIGDSIHNLDIPVWIDENNLTIKDAIVYYTELAGQDTKTSDVVPTTALKAFNPENDIGISFIPNTS